MTSRVHVVALIGALTLLARSVAAQPGPEHPPRPDLDAWINEGIRLRAERRDEEALARFQRAWDLSHSPEALAQMALAEQALGRWVEAERDLLAALGVQDHPWITRNRPHLDASVAEIRRHLGSIEVRCATPGARVRIDAREEVPLPLAGPLRVEVGTVRVEVMAEGYVTARRELEVRPGDDLLETFRLVPVETRAETPVISPRVTRPDAAPSPLRMWGTGLLIAGGVTLAGGITALVWREVSAAAFNGPNTPRCYLDDAMPDVVYGGSRCVTLRSQVVTAESLAITGFVATGAFAVSGLVLWLIAPRTPRRALVTCAPGALSLTCGAVF
jgi:hypothetical protein